MDSWHQLWISSGAIVRIAKDTATKSANVASSVLGTGFPYAWLTENAFSCYSSNDAFFCEKHQALSKGPLLIKRRNSNIQDLSIFRNWKAGLILKRRSRTLVPTRFSVVITRSTDGLDWRAIKIHNNSTLREYFVGLRKVSFTLVYNK